jgi:hypothetical protein
MLITLLETGCHLQQPTDPCKYYNFEYEFVLVRQVRILAIVFRDVTLCTLVSRYLFFWRNMLLPSSGQTADRGFLDSKLIESAHVA